MNAPSSELYQAIAVTAELTGTTMSEGAARVMASDLSLYPLEQVLGALTRCRKEVRSRLTIADVIQRLEDGRPGPEEAWAMLPKDESSSVVWTREMQQAWAVASGLIAEGETVQARMAFLEHYRTQVQRARDEGVPVNWTPSLGHSPSGRESVLREAVEKGRLTAQHVAGLLPHNSDQYAPELLQHAKPKPVAIW